MERYESYKDSGIDWLGEIPNHWEVKLGFTVIKERKEKNKGMISNNVLSLSYGKIIEKPIEKLTGLVPENFETYQLVYEGDIIFRPTDLQNDKVSLRTGLSNYYGIITSAYINLQPINNSVPKFIHYFLHTTDTNKVIYGLGSGLRQNISFLDFKRFLFALPPIHEQEAIASFLDDKCAKIDDLVAIKEQQINKLKELRQIKIHQVVIKGLDASVELKYSGIDWIGEIPKHWEVKRLKNVLASKLKYGANESGYDYDANLSRYIRISDFGFDGKLNDSKKLSLPDNIAKDYLLKDGDILFARSGATVGKAYQFKTSLGTEKSYCYAGYLIKAEPDITQLLSDSLNYYTQSGAFMNWKDSIFNKATIENIGADKYSELFVPIPPISEQEAIVAYLQQETAKIDQAIVQRQEQIEKLKAYKQSLINEVVTGKVKVA